MHKFLRRLLSGWIWLALALPCAADVGALDGQRHRVLVSTDIGGTDPDDDQSMVHLLLYADVLELEGLVSSPYGPGRRQDILEVIAHYEADYPTLKTHSSGYPTPEALRSISKQGALESPRAAGTGNRSEGSDWIIRCARKDDPRPLHVLVWGGLEDLAQALHDAPDILPKLRVYFIGGPNKTWSLDAYHYIARHHAPLWIIEANATYRGWFTGGNQSGAWGNQQFVTQHLAGHGALGNYFAGHLKGKMKMGDTPSVAWLLRGFPDDPAKPGWGGQFVRLYAERHTTFTRLTTAGDSAEVFSVVEITLPRPEGFTDAHHARILFDNRIPATGTAADGLLRFRFSPRDAKVWPYVIESDSAQLQGQRGAFTATPATAGPAASTPPLYPDWWIDDPAPAVAEGVHPGAKSVNRWREDFLRDFANRMDRCLRPATR